MDKRGEGVGACSLMGILLILKMWISLRGGLGSDNVDKVILLNFGTF